MANNIDRRGKQNVLEGYNTFSKHAPYFSVWQGRNLKFQYTGDDIAEGEELLSDNLAALEQAGSDAIFSVRFHNKRDKDNFVTDKTPYVSSFNFKLTEEQNNNNIIAGVQPYTPANNVLMQRIDSLIEQQTAILSRLNALEEDDEEEETTNEQPQGIAGVIGAFLNTPQGTMIATNVINGLINKFVGTPLPQTFQQPVGLAGVEEKKTKTRKPKQLTEEEAGEMLKTALERLMAADDQLPQDLTKLADIAESNPAQFNLLISMLRKQ